MKKRPLLLLPLLGVALCAQGAGMKVDVEIPQLDVAEYHRPYLAVWIEREDSSVAANLAVWYQQEREQRPRDGQARGGNAGRAGGGGNGPGGGGGESGTKWLPDLRQWWRRSGRSTAVPIDGVTGATRPVGMHAIELQSGTGPIATLADGSYRLVVEAAREVGGRELLKIPFQWPPAAAQDLSAQGKSELGRIALTLTP
jgi:hypothetical protein